jgi:hypothetical protein
MKTRIFRFFIQYLTQPFSTQKTTHEKDFPTGLINHYYLFLLL